MSYQEKGNYTFTLIFQLINPLLLMPVYFKEKLSYDSYLKLEMFRFMTIDINSNLEIKQHVIKYLLYMSFKCTSSCIMNVITTMLDSIHGEICPRSGHSHAKGGTYDRSPN